MNTTYNEKSSAAKIRINWEGSLFCHHSLAMVNREFLSELTYHPELAIRHIPYEPDQFTPEDLLKYRKLDPMLDSAFKDADIHIRHKYPPDFKRPDHGRLILMQPWEYGSLPVIWRDQMIFNADEIWVYTHYLRKCYIHSGIPENKVFTIPLGVDPDHFNPSKPPLAALHELTKNRYCFFFNGGVTLRKGVDILVNAYLNEFKATEPVCLVIKDSSAYGKNLAAKVEELSKRDDIAKLIYFNENIDHFNLPGLYTACDCYVHPYRAEGYGLPIAEALSCGKPVIVTGGGACLDFVEPEMGYFIKCSVEHMKEKRVSDMDTIDYPFWFVPDMQHLQKVMRFVFEHQDDAREKGVRAGELVRLKHSWTRSAKLARDRFALLSGITIPNDNIEESRSLMLEYAVKLLKDSKFADASELFTIVLQNYGDNSASYEGLGLIAFQQKRFTDSFEYLKIANRISPAEPDILLNWSEAARCTGMLFELKRPLQHALQLNANNDDLKMLARELGMSITT